MDCSNIIEENRAYWSNRAGGYSQINQEELHSESYRLWGQLFREQLLKAFPEHSLSDDPYPEYLFSRLQVLDVGCGPGFFAILLTKMGCQVTAVDLTPNMICEAKKNAGDLSGQIEFLNMNAEALEFEDGTFDVVVSRNLTWDLPNPKEAYREWVRVLKKGGLLLNFDANWYHYLYDERARLGFEQDRVNTASHGFKDRNIGENFDIMEGIARRVPLTQIQRPEWDQQVLSDLGLEVSVEQRIWQQVWTEDEKTNFASTPLFLVRGRV